MSLAIYWGFVGPGAANRIAAKALLLHSSPECHLKSTGFPRTHLLEVPGGGTAQKTGQPEKLLSFPGS